MNAKLAGIQEPVLNKSAERIAGALALPHLAADLRRVEVALSNIDEAGGYEGQFSELSSMLVHLARADGKRIRPALVLCAFYTTRSRGENVPAAERAVAAAAAVELMHLGSLYHDDVIDEAATRRGVESANARWGNVVAILAGDALLAESAAISAALGETEAALMAATLRDVCKGELAETVSMFSPGRTEEEYRACIGGKTAALMATATELGALEAEATPAVQRALRTFGFELGMAFQIVDDLLDLTAEESTVGKPVGHDLLEGVYNLPVILAIRREPGLRELLTPGLDEETALEISRRIGGAGACLEAWKIAVRHFDRARLALLHVEESLTPSPMQALLCVADLIAAQYSPEGAGEFAAAR